MSTKAGCKICSSKHRVDIERMMLLKGDMGLTNEDIIKRIMDDYNEDINQVNLNSHQSHIEFLPHEVQMSVDAYRKQAADKAYLDVAQMMEEVLGVGMAQVRSLEWNGVGDLIKALTEYNKIVNGETLNINSGEDYRYQLALHKVLEVLQRRDVGMEILEEIRAEIKPILEAVSVVDEITALPAEVEESLPSED